MDNRHYRNQGSGKVIVGLVLLFIGSLLLVRSLGFYIPSWLTSWPMILIAIGVISGMRHQFKNPSSYILITIGGVFLIERMFPGLSFFNFILPVLIIGLGLYLIFGKNRSRDFFRQGTKADEWDRRVPVADEIGTEQTTSSASFSKTDDYLDAVCVFGGVKKNILTKNFKGGEVVTIMGGAELNFSQADLAGTVVLDVTQVFGGIKIILPPHWKVSSEMAAIFGGIEDKRQFFPENIANDKLLVIKGTSIFGGIDIRSF